MPNPEGVRSLRDYFEELLRRPERARSLSDKDVGWLGDQIGSGTTEQISGALPAIFTCATSSDPKVRLLSVVTLQGISTRADRLGLLSIYLPRLSELLSSDDPRVVSFVADTLSNVWPKPPPEALRQLLSYLSRPDGDWRTQGDVIRYLISGAAENSEVVPAVVRYMCSPLEPQARIAALGVLANSRSQDPRIINLLVSSLEDPELRVRSAAFQGLLRMGPVASRQAAPAMQKAVSEYAALLGQENGDVSQKISAAQRLLNYSPNAPRVVDAVVGFYSTPLDKEVRLALQDALRIPLLKNTRLIDLVVGSLRDPDPEVRANSVYVLKDMGSHALKRASPILESLAQDPAQPANVKDAVRKALELAPPNR